MSPSSVCPLAGGKIETAPVAQIVGILFIKGVPITSYNISKQQQSFQYFNRLQPHILN